MASKDTGRRCKVRAPSSEYLLLLYMLDSSAKRHLAGVTFFSSCGTSNLDELVRRHATAAASSLCAPRRGSRGSHARQLAQRAFVAAFLGASGFGLGGHSHRGPPRGARYLPGVYASLFKS
jgi:hypothetical protein